MNDTRAGSAALGIEAEERDLLHGLAVLHLAAGSVPRALSLLMAASHGAPDHPGVLRALAHAETLAGQPERALSTLDRIARLDALQPVDLLLRARALAAAGRRAEGRASFAAYLSATRPPDRAPDP